MFKSRLLEESDYPQLVEWWKWHRFSPPLQEMLPDNGTCGIMLSKDGINICTGFIYFTNSKMCWIEFIVSNPDYRESDRKECLELLINSLCNLAGNYGFKVAYTNLKNASLIDRFTDCEFVKGSVNTTEMIRGL
jgi:hypothetical protein